MTFDKILFYASVPTGMSYPLEPSIARKVDTLVSEGKLERRTRTVTVPAVPNYPESAKKLTLYGLDCWSEREVVLDTVHAIHE